MNILILAVLMLYEICSSGAVKLYLWISQKNDCPENCSWSNFKIAVSLQMERLKVADVTACKLFLP